MIAALIILVLCEVVLLAYYYEIAPDCRVLLELQLYEIHDEVTLLKAECNSQVAKSDCSILQDSIVFLLCRLSRMSIGSLIFVESESRRDPGFLIAAQERARILDECTVPRVRALRQQALKIATKAFAVNGFPWSMLLIAPSVRASVRGRLRILTCLSIHEFEQATPSHRRPWGESVKNA